MSLEGSLLILAATIIVGLVAYIWNDRNRRAEREALDPIAVGTLIGKVDRLEQDYRSLRDFNDKHLPIILEGIKSDCYGTIANNKADFEKRLDRLDRKVFNGHRE